MIGGWLEPLPAKERAEIARRYPAMDIEAVEREYGYYKLFRDGLTEQPSSAGMRSALTRWRKQIKALMEATVAIEQTPLGSIIRQTTGLRGYPDAMEHLKTSLLVLDRVLPLIGQPSGRRANPRQMLAAQLASLVSAAGLAADRRPTGPLCQILQIVLMAAGESPTSLVEIVKPLLAPARRQSKKTR